jgi:excisionase family DNA binding protein
MPVRLTIEEAAKQSGLSVSTLQKLTASAEVSSVRLGRRRLYVFDQLMAELEDRGRRDRVVAPSSGDKRRTK